MKNCRGVLCSAFFFFSLALPSCLPMTLTSENCQNGEDDDGDGNIDCIDPECAIIPACVPENCNNQQDDNGDGFFDCDDIKCEDSPLCLVSCGNGKLETGELCDDGNNQDGDSCEGDCALPRCGNDILDLGEQCDDGNFANNDGCESDCTHTPEGGGGADFLSDEAESAGGGGDNFVPPTAVSLNCPWLSQAPPGSFTAPGGNHNCGPTSLIMADACLNDTNPTSQDIVNLLNFMDTNITNYDPGPDFNGMNTTTTQLKSLAENFFGLSATRLNANSGMTLQRAYDELLLGHPVIVGVLTQSSNNFPNDVMVSGGIGHFVVLEGMTQTHVIINDPGRSASLNGQNRKYTISSFINIWDLQNKAAVIIKQNECLCQNTSTVGQLNGSSDPAVESAFLEAYSRSIDLIGCPVDAGGGEFVHDVRGVLLQDFLQEDPSCPLDGSGDSAIIYNPTDSTAWRVHSGFWGVYKCLVVGGVPNGGAVLLGAPTDEEHPDPIFGTIQNFEFGQMWFDETTIHVHPGTSVDLTQVSACANVDVDENPSCGNLFLENGEQCEDGNLTNGDGCSSTCQVEAQPTCGDGTVNNGEACDNGGANSDTTPDACRTSCELPSCGDGTIDSGELCDDGNQISGDGCGDFFFFDNDQDGYGGDPGLKDKFCSPVGAGKFTAVVTGDCNDSPNPSTSAVHPGALDSICDGIIEGCFCALQGQVQCSNDVGCDPAPSCGDGTCNGTETCSNCNSDCGVCTLVYYQNFEDPSLFTPFITGSQTWTDSGQCIDPFDKAYQSFGPDLNSGSSWAVNVSSVGAFGDVVLAVPTPSITASQTLRLDFYAFNPSASSTKTIQVQRTGPSGSGLTLTLQPGGWNHFVVDLTSTSTTGSVLFLVGSVDGGADGADLLIDEVQIFLL